MVFFLEEKDIKKLDTVKKILSQLLSLTGTEKDKLTTKRIYADAEKKLGRIYYRYAIKKETIEKKQLKTRRDKISRNMKLSSGVLEPIKHKLEEVAHFFEVSKKADSKYDIRKSMHRNIFTNMIDYPVGGVIFSSEKLEDMIALQEPFTQALLEYTYAICNTYQTKLAEINVDDILEMMKKPKDKYHRSVIVNAIDRAYLSLKPVIIRDEKEAINVHGIVERYKTNPRRTIFYVTLDEEYITIRNNKPSMLFDKRQFTLAYDSISFVLLAAIEDNYAQNQSKKNAEYITLSYLLSLNCFKTKNEVDSLDRNYKGRVIKPFEYSMSKLTKDGVLNSWYYAYKNNDGDFIKADASEVNYNTREKIYVFYELSAEKKAGIFPKKQLSTQKK